MKFAEYWKSDEAFAFRHSDEETQARAAWNAAVRECEAIIRERYDPCEPWLDPGELTKIVGLG